MLIEVNQQIFREERSCVNIQLLLKVYWSPLMTNNVNKMAACSGYCKSLVQLPHFMLLLFTVGLTAVTHGYILL